MWLVELFEVSCWSLIFCKLLGWLFVSIIGQFELNFGDLCWVIWWRFFLFLLVALMEIISVDVGRVCFNNAPLPDRVSSCLLWLLLKYDFWSLTFFEVCWVLILSVEVVCGSGIDVPFFSSHVWRLVVWWTSYLSPSRSWRSLLSISWILVHLLRLPCWQMFSCYCSNNFCPIIEFINVDEKIILVDEERLTLWLLLFRPYCIQIVLILLP